MKNNKNILFVLHIILLILLCIITAFFAPFVVFLYDDPHAGGFMLYAFTILWFCMPVLIIVSLLAAIILKKTKHIDLAKKITFFPYLALLLEGIIGFIYFTFH